MHQNAGKQNEVEEETESSKSLCGFMNKTSFQISDYKTEKHTELLVNNYLTWRENWMEKERLFNEQQYPDF